MAPFTPEVAWLVDRFGYGAVGLTIGLESMGVPCPGEAALIAMATYAGLTGHVSIWGVVAAAAAGAVVGDNLGYWIGRTLGQSMLRRYGHYVRIGAGRMRLGQYLFAKHGGTVVFLGRFVAVLRAMAALLAGTNRMRWGRFLAFNAISGVAWAGLYGFGAFLLGGQVDRLSAPAGVALSVGTAALVVGGLLLIRRHEARLQVEADRMFPEADAA